ncbi:MAG: argininosuccinate lyase [Candidatus Poribacteria bacterium]
MMGARGQAGARDSVLAYTDSTGDDMRMLHSDIWGNEAHTLMLGAQGIVPPADVREILRALQRARREADAGEFVMDERLEDVHMNVEAYVSGIAGAQSGGRMHTARSRNDQVLTDARMTIREELLDLEAMTCELANAFLVRAEEHADAVMPGYTHTQHAQPITLGFWATAYAALFVEDLRRIKACYATVNRNPLGACALAGTDFPIDRDLTARLLGFDGVDEHALAVISNRDFIVEPLFALSMLMTNLSRLAAEIVYGTSYEFRMWTLDDSYAMGSSIMPQKKNPDVAELARARSAKVCARLQAVLGTLKGLPLGYHSDLQEDKPPFWEAMDTATGTVAITTEVVRTMTPNTDRMLDLTYGNFSTATELANYLVREADVPFREAHDVVGKLVMELVERDKNFRDVALCDEILATHGRSVGVDILKDVLDPTAAVRRNRSAGGTSPDAVKAMTERLKAEIATHAADVGTRQASVDSARNDTAASVQAVIDGATIDEALTLRG